MIRWHEVGMSPGAASMLWSLSVLSEVVVVVVGPALPRRACPAGSLALAAIAGAVRWGAAASTASFTVMAMVEPLHGLSFALVHLTCVTVIGRIVPPALAATAQAFWAMALLCALALPLTLRLRLIAP